MAGKHVAFVGELRGLVTCECGEPMALVKEKTYVCMNKMCQRYNKEYTAIVMAPVLFYEKEKKR